MCTVPVKYMNTYNIKTCKLVKCKRKTSLFTSEYKHNSTTDMGVGKGWRGKYMNKEQRGGEQTYNVFDSVKSG